ncbi:MAG: ferric reductase-like transmembrane domain-containing protein [Candidatus Diapherotrites archaeon]|nr:ferric reductase-like transmembrane domain-containing protein [Candidatus Diapherotrites archaeon]
MRKVLYIFLALATVLLAAYQSLFPIPALTSTIRFLALEGFFLLCVSLIVGPLAVLNPEKFCALIKPRKAIGIASFAVVLAHFFLAFANFKADPAVFFSSPSLSIAFFAFLILVLIALTSTQWALEKLGFFKWKTIQRLAYFVFALSLAHFLLSSNGLFVVFGSKVFVNAAEISMLALAGITIALQVLGFLKTRSLKAKRAETPEANCKTD